MHGSVIRLIASKEFRDLIRDRRTVMLILVLPAVLYPLFGLSGYVFAVSLTSRPAVVGILGAETLTGIDVPLVTGDQFTTEPEQTEEPTSTIRIKPLPADTDPQAELQAKSVDVVILLPLTLADDLAAGERPTVRLLNREGDEKSKLATKRVAAALSAWEGKLRAKRFEARGLPADFDRILTLVNPQTDKPKAKLAADELRDSFARVFPFILIMWLVAGAIQPAVDMTAGEKERGTMETLLISPAARSEIVLGKFIATTVFAFASVIWNVLWLTAGALLIQTLLGFPVISLPGVIGCVVLALPQAMLFSAVCLALGIFAKSTKEGQYYLMPLILFTMPLAFWSMLPGTELTPLMSLVPVTGPMLLQGRLLAVTGDPVSWELVLLVLGSSLFWVSLALGFAVWQFNREGVLFRETGPAGGKSPFAGLFARRSRSAPVSVS